MLYSHALTVIGAGSYGTALAIAVASKGYLVTLCARDEQTATLLNKERSNNKYLKGILFPPSLKVTASYQEACNFCNTLLIVVPSAAFVQILRDLKPFLTSEHQIAWATKGLEAGSCDLLSNVAKRELAPLDLPLAAISGPTFARELASNLPTAIACAGLNSSFVNELCTIMHTPTFRIYQSHDFIALQLGGAVKNVLAIGAGMSDGLGYGANARTALISRGLAEMIRLGVALGATEKGFMGLSGLGDLMLTCTDDQSRNRRFGFMLGKGISVEQALQSIGQVVEGYHMVKEVYHLAQKLKVDMPICKEIYEVIVNHKPGYEAAISLLKRELTVE